MQLTEKDKEDLDELIRIFEGLREKRGAEQVKGFLEMSETFASATASNPLFGVVATFFSRVADLDQVERDTGLDAFIANMKEGRNS
jgi:hypothetical protein